MNESKIVYGSYVTEDIKGNVKSLIEELKENNKRIPRLVTILVGNDYGSTKYVNLKTKDCNEVGINTTNLHYETYQIDEDGLISLIDELNNDDTVDGILVQLPLPDNFNEERVMEAIEPSKDVDCFNPINVGKLYTSGYENNMMRPCTPQGIIRTLEKIGYDSLAGMHAVVLGRSNIVGKPAAKLLMDKGATVTICHSKTKNIKDIVRQADIVVAAVGKAKMIKSDWIKEGAIVIDVGINRDNGKMCGDVDLEDVIDKVKYITPVPKGIGEVTRAMLLDNTITAYCINERKNYRIDETKERKSCRNAFRDMINNIIEKHGSLEELENLGINIHPTDDDLQ